jgi:hypothetical protein
MSKADSNFDAWLAKGLQTPTAKGTDFTQKVLERFRQQEAERLLKHIQIQKRILGFSVSAVIITAAASFLVFPLDRDMYSSFQSIVTGFIEMIMEPDLYELAIPGIVIALILLAVWNAIEIVSLE